MFIIYDVVVFRDLNFNQVKTLKNTLYQCFPFKYEKMTYKRVLVEFLAVKRSQSSFEAMLA